MKKNHFYFLASLLFFMTFSCTPTKEDVIKKEFKGYVSKNFDDPKSLKEIVEICVIDTVSYEDYVETLNNLDTLKKYVVELDSLISKRHGEFLDNTLSFYKKSKRRLSEYQYKRVEKNIYNHIDLINEKSNWEKNYSPKLNNTRSEIDSLLSRLVDIVILETEIKTRIEENGTLKLQSFYALEDNIRDEIIILDHKPKIIDYPQIVQDFFDKCTEYNQILDVLGSITKKEKDNFEELKDLFY